MLQRIFDFDMNEENTVPVEVVPVKHTRMILEIRDTDVDRVVELLDKSGIYFHLDEVEE